MYGVVTWTAAQFALLLDRPSVMNTHFVITEHTTFLRQKPESETSVDLLNPKVWALATKVPRDVFDVFVFEAFGAKPSPSGRLIPRDRKDVFDSYSSWRGSSMECTGSGLAHSGHYLSR